MTETNIIYSYIFKYNLSCVGEAEFSAAITPVFSVTWPFKLFSVAAYNLCGNCNYFFQNSLIQKNSIYLN